MNPEAESATDMRKVLADVAGLAESLCEAEGLELVHIEYQREPGGRILRIYIDRAGGVTLDDCVRVNRQLGDLLDVRFGETQAYTLEISSPGTDRPLGKAADFEKYKGELAKIKISEPIAGQKNFRGVLSGISDGMVNLRINQETVLIPYVNITRARLINYHGENKCT